MLEKALSFDAHIVEVPFDTPFYRLSDYDDRERPAIIVSYDWCYTLVILFDSLGNSRLAGFGDTCVVFRLSSLPSSDDRRLYQNKSITFACVFSGLKLQLRTVSTAALSYPLNGARRYSLIA